MALETETGHQQYYFMDSAPKDGTVIMGLCGRKYPEAIYYSSGAWHYWLRPVTTPCYPDYWCWLPGDTPSGYMQLDVASSPRWLPIATAPTDATVVLVLLATGHTVTAYYSGGWKNFVGDGAVVPVWWIPEPTLPAGYP
jgi:hypothetical protein